MTCWYIKSPLSMNFNYSQLTVFSFLVLSYTATYVGGQCNLICWYMGNFGSLWEHACPCVYTQKLVVFTATIVYICMQAQGSL